MSLRHIFAWSNTWDSWRERLVGLLFLVVGALLLYLSVKFLAFWLAAILWSIYGITLAVASRQGWIKLFGPVLFYDMVRTARRSRYSLIRILYGGFLFITLCYLVMILAMTPRFGQQLRPRDTAMVAEWFFAFFMIVQVIVVVVLTPAYVAGAIAEEKDRKTLEFLLATDLDNREIVFSKLLSRLANMTLLLLTGLPILSILQLMGGVDPELMLAGFAGVGLTMLGIASVSILFSTLFKKPRDAISVTYLFLLAYGCVASVALASYRHPLALTPIWFGEDPPTLREAIMVLNAGNPIAAIGDVVSAIEGRNRAGARTNLGAELAGILTRYAWFHLALAASCLTWSILRVRAIALKQTSAGTTMVLQWFARFRPRVGSFPMLWKEIFIEGRTKVNWLVWLAALAIVVLALGPGVWAVGDFFVNRQNFDEFIAKAMLWQDPFGQRFREEMNYWFRFAGTAVGCLSILMLGVRAATCVTSERERDTFDSLVTTPMSAESILFAKVVGNLFSNRPVWLWFGAIMLLALITGGLNPLAVPIIVAAWFVYALFVTLLGTMFSLFSQSSIWSVIWTMVATIFLGGGHWLITTCFCMPLFALVTFNLGVNQNGRMLNTFAEYFMMFQGGMTPPAVFAMCSFGWDDHVMREQKFWEFVGFCVLGLFLWMFVSAILWFGILVPKFRHIARRLELEYD